MFKMCLAGYVTTFRTDSSETLAILAEYGMSWKLYIVYCNLAGKLPRKALLEYKLQ